ncbi:unnamed protein product [Sphagnum jensenii]
MMVTTNTFSLTSPQLDKFDIKGKQAELLGAAITIAKSAVTAKRRKSESRTFFWADGCSRGTARADFAR